MIRPLAAKLSAPLLVILGLIGVLGPFGTDIYLPAFPQMARDLGTTPSGIQLSLSGFTVGMAVGQLVLGPTSDRFGRKPIVAFGTLLMFVASYLASVSSQLWLLILCCVFIGVAAAAGQVCGRAIVSDLAVGNQASRGFSLMGLVTGLGPIVAPIAGAGILVFSDWRGIFLALGLMAAVLAALAFVAVPETLTKANRHSGGLAAQFGAVGQVFANRNFRTHATILWAGFGMMFAYISASPFVLEEIYGMTPFEYTLDFGANGIAMMVTGLLAAQLVNRLGPLRLILLGVVMQVAGTLLLVVVWVFGVQNPWPVLIAFALIPSSLGFVFGPVTALGLRELRHIAGSAMAVQGSVQFVFAGITAFLVGLGGSTAIGPLALVLAGLAAVAIGALMAARRLVTNR